MVCAKMLNVKKQRLLTNFIVSDEGESSSESRELLTSISESDNVVYVHYLRKFLPRWKMLFPWAECEEGENEVIYCKDCR